MSYQKHNFTPGAVLFASQLNDMDNQIEFLSNQGSSLSDNFKTALLNCFENVAWINENGQLYYDALYDSLYPDNMWSITNTLTGCTTSNNATSILKNNSYVATITANEGYTLNGATVSITMGGNDVTNLYYSSGSINIPNVTGDLVITVLASSAVTSISAVFTQGSAVIYDTDSLNTLKQYLVVTATYSDSTTVVVTGYTLSGTLEVGTSTITVSYGGKTTTFNVSVTAWTLTWSYLDGGMPSNVAPNDWTTTIASTSYVSFVTGMGIRYNTTDGGGTFQINPTNYETTNNSVIEIVTNIVTMPIVNGVVLRGGNGTIGMQASFSNNGLSIDNSVSYVSGVSITTNTEYTFRIVCNVSGTCYVYIDGQLVSTVQASAIGNKKNQVMMTVGGGGRTMDAYIKAIRFATN